MDKQYDVVVIGAGPAGLMVSQLTAQHGLKVLLVEQKTDIARVFRSCCCNLIIEAGTHHETVKLADRKIIFEQNGFAVPYSGSFIPLENSIKISPGGQTFRVKGNSPEGYVAVSFEKEALLQDMLKVVKQQDVEILNGTKGVRAENVEDGVLVTIKNSSGEFVVKAKVVVAADGVNSKIVQSLGLNKTRRKFFGRFAVVAYHIEGVQCPYPNAWNTFVGKGHTSSGFGQFYLCPKPYHGKTTPPVYELTYGMPVMEKSDGPSAVQEFDHFITKGGFADWFKNAKIVERRAGILNFYTPLVNPIEGHVVVVGDAAAFIETYVQGAIMYGYQAGNAIIKYLDTGSGLEEYAESWKHSFEYNDPEEIKAATQAFGLHVLKDDELDYFFSLTKDDNIKGFVNEFSDPQTVREAIFSHLEQVKRERPELGAKLEAFQNVSVESALQVE